MVAEPRCDLGACLLALSHGNDRGSQIEGGSRLGDPGGLDDTIGETRGTGSSALAAPAAPARDDVDQRHEGDDDYRSDRDDGDSGRGDDHPACLPCVLLVKTLGGECNRSGAAERL
jgi:hypothetical protein